MVHPIDYIIALIIAVIAVLILLFVENSVTIAGSSVYTYDTINDFDAVPLKGCNPADPANAEEITDSDYYETTTVYFNKCYPRCLKITTIKDRKTSIESSCGS